MNLKGINMVYMLGIGGIGMSALARYFASMGVVVCGYDRTSTALTDALQSEGIAISFRDDVASLPAALQKNDRLLVVYTPAIPAENSLLKYFRENGFNLHKRSQVLGWITANSFNISVAGTHGKTTTATCITHLLLAADKKCNAFLGGISTNYQSNVVLNKEANISVAEADEFDRSFLQLFPDIAVVTSVDADHLDIYGESGSVLAAFQEFTGRIQPSGVLISREGLPLRTPKGIQHLTYAIGSKTADVAAENIQVREGAFYFDLLLSGNTVSTIKCGLPGRHNIENALAAIAVALQLGIDVEDIAAAVATFKGVKRRFEYILNSDKIRFIDDYAHHPREISSCLEAIRELYPAKKLTGIFQPHLYTRTRDFLPEFARSLEALDELILLDIYPAREQPIPGVTSEALLQEVSLSRKFLLTPEKLVNAVKALNPEVLVTMGAGDIDKLVEPLKAALHD